MIFWPKEGNELTFRHGWPIIGLPMRSDIHGIFTNAWGISILFCNNMYKIGRFLNFY